jgi:iron complex outermembrane recepter protein
VLRGRGAFALACAACAVLGAPRRSLAQQPAAGAPDIAGLDIEELGRIRVTSTSRRPEPASRATAALFVVTREDIRRFGASSIPEALRLVPGLQVARVTARDWSITARGFAEQSPNKLLVLVDGRAIYSPLFAGTFWDVQDVVMEDVDRIEVILGPGATLWGSNAVNGVINVITRSAADTRSRLLAVHAGTAEHLNGSAHYGTSLGAAGALRVYGSFLDRAPSHLAGGEPGEDDWQQGQGGFRADLDAGARDRLTFQGDLYAASGGAEVRGATLTAPFSAVTEDELDAHGGNLLARWSRQLGDASELQVQAYYDRSTRKLPSSYGHIATDIADIDLQYRVPLARRHDVVWGAGYRLNSDSVSGSFPVALVPPARTTHLVTAFAQDEIELTRDRWYATVGAKLEHNDLSGLELQPNLRLLWLPNPRHTIWSALSRAVRIPSRLDADVQFVTQVFPTSPLTLVRVDGNEDFRSEELVSLEGGYRALLSRTLSADLSLYYGWYDRLRSITPLAPFAENGTVVQPLRVDNDARGHSWGGTVAATWQARPDLRLQGSYTLLEMAVESTPDAPPGSFPNVIPGYNPEHQAALRSSLDLPRGLEADLALRYVGVLPDPRIPGYVEADARLGWSPRPGLTLALVGRDLLHDQHPEFSSLPQREIQRRGEVQLEWRF